MESRQLPAMAFASAPSAQPQVSAPCLQSLQAGLMRTATALGAVIGLSAMAAQGATSGQGGLPNGTYLYGESPVAHAIGSLYFVFQVAEGDLTGAIYQPSSSFDCVHGTVNSAALDLVIVDAYDQAERPYSVALTSAEAVVANRGGGAPMAQLEGMYPIRNLSSLDVQLLEACSQ